jgi:hypothetical protein
VGGEKLAGAPLAGALVSGFEVGAHVSPVSVGFREVGDVDGALMSGLPVGVVVGARVFIVGTKVGARLGEVVVMVGLDVGA